MKSRTVAVLCALVLTAGALAGCGNSKASDTKEKTKTENTADDSEEEITVEEEEPVSDEEAEDAGFSDGSDGSDSGTVLDTSEELTGIHHANISIKDYGNISVELDADTAPITVTNFV